jgi:hypothetical protein
MSGLERVPLRLDRVRAAASVVSVVRAERVTNRMATHVDYMSTTSNPTNNGRDDIDLT